ncbi:Crp/Fnr family transcriptional regulator [Glycomyces sambucus]|nr:Crp/Fnr family transcriptional regulator [Glycomyces sambucus]
MDLATDSRREPLIDESDFDSLGPGVHRLSYPSRTLLVRDGDRTDFVLFIIEGYAKSVSHDPECILGIHRPGRLVGELAALTRRPRSADLVALTDIEALFIPADTFSKLITDGGPLALAVAERLAERVQELGARVESITSAEQRLARAVIELARSGIGTERDDGLHLTGFNQRDLASLAGISRESVSAILRPLKRRNAVSIGRQRITIHDLAPFEAIAQRNDKAL